MYSRTASLILVATIILAAQPAPCQQYYRGGQLVPIAVDSNFVQIKFDDAVSDEEQQQYLELIGRITHIVDHPLARDSFLICSLRTIDNFSPFLDSIKAIQVIRHAEPYYMDQDGYPRLVSDRFCISFVRGTSIDEIESINDTYGVEIDHELQHMGGVYVLVNSPSSGKDIVEIANLYYELDVTNFSHPCFALEGGLDSYTLYDEYHSYQYHLKKVIGQFNQASVWDFAGMNDTINVAVLDDGIDWQWWDAHPDLDTSNVLQGWDFVDGDSDPAPGYLSSHGMACAGIIASDHCVDSSNGQSDSSFVISINPKSQILPVRIADEFGFILNEIDMAEAINWTWKQEVDVLSCSFSYSTKDIDDALHVALDSAYRFGRDGKGCVSVFSAGNDSHNYPHSPGSDSTVIPVAAIRLNDSLWDYSNWASGNGLVAPSGACCLQGDVWTLDRCFSDGVNPHVDSLCGLAVTWDCPDESPYNDEFINCHMGGTSAACPLVSGTASLILAKDTSLTSAEVYEILRNSAVTELDWGTITAPDTIYGYGRVDAFRAVLSISRGDVDNDGGNGPSIGDLVTLVNYMFNGGPAPFPSVLLGDVNCDGEVDIGDLNYLTNYMFYGGPAPINPCFEFGD